MTMPLLDLQKSLRLLGKLRMGETKPTSNGKTRPAKLAEWRMTSPSYELLEVAAAIYGGEVGIWEGAPTEGKQYELYTTTDRLQVVVPPANALLQSYETWSAGGCSKRCDGVTEELSGRPCFCPADHEERAALAAKGKACKITSRLKVLLPDIPDIGVWMLESHGYYAAVELAGFEEIMAMATVRGTMIPAQLRIDQRTAKRNGETRRYAVPVLELVTVTAHQLARGEVAALGQSAPALGSGARELEAPRVPQRRDAPEARATGNGGPPMPLLPHEIVTTASPSYDAGDGGSAGGKGAASVESPSVNGNEQLPEDSPPQSRTSGVGGDAVTSNPQAASSSAPVNRVAIVAREAGLDDTGRHELCEWASRGRVQSSKLLTEAETVMAVDGAHKIKAGTHALARRDDGSLGLKDARFGFSQDPPTGSADPVTVDDMPLDELRTHLRSRLEPLNDDGKKAWKAAGLPALSRLGEEHRELALATVLAAEEAPFG